MRILVLALLLLPACATVEVHTQDDGSDNLQLVVVATTSEGIYAPRTAAEADFEVLINGKRSFTTTLDSTEAKPLFLELGHLYEFRIEGFDCMKRIQLDTRNIPFEDQLGGFTLDLEVFLPKGLNRAQRRYLRQNLIGIAAFSEETKNIEFDFEHTAQTQAHLETLAP